MSAVKEKMADVIQNQPEDATFEEILRELAFEQMIASGLKDSREGKTISNDGSGKYLNGQRRGVH